MTRKRKILLGIAAAVLIAAVLLRNMWLGHLKTFLEKWEGFSAVPYWDVSRWSWGYGTPAPGPEGSITPEQGWKDALARALSDYKYLKPLITRELNPFQWAALLSFSYNLGPGNADNLVPNINAGDNQALGVQWNKYIYSGGTVNNNLVKRRAAEWALWNT